MWDAELDDVLRNTTLLSSLTTDERAELGATGRVVRARRGSTLIRQGDEAGGMSVVLTGSVRIDLELRDGRRQTLAVLAPGDVFGELSLLDQAPRSASAIADSDARVFLINAEEFNVLRGKYRPAAYKILRALGPTLCARLRGVESLVAQRLRERGNGSDASGSGPAEPARRPAPPPSSPRSPPSFGNAPDLSPPPLPSEAISGAAPAEEPGPTDLVVEELVVDPANLTDDAAAAEIEPGAGGG